jgi:hypothetical protein
VDQEQRRRIGIAPIGIVELEPLRNEAVGGWALKCHAAR